MFFDPMSPNFPRGHSLLNPGPGWTQGALQAMIASQLHERSQPALTNFDRAVPEAGREAVREIVKDPVVLDFLGASALRWP